MTGLAYFPFFCRDWFLDTRDLTNAEKGVYIDLMAAMYARGDSLPYTERELCRITGCATARSLRPLLKGLIAKDKIKVVGAALVNNRAMEEIAAANERIAKSSKGGKAKAAAAKAEKSSVPPEFEPSSSRTHRETIEPFQQNQSDNACQPKPKPNKKEPASDDAAPHQVIPMTSNPTAAKPKNIADAIFGSCLEYLVGTGIKEQQARALLGQWRRDHGDEAVSSAVLAAQRVSASEPRAYIIAVLRKQKRQAAGGGGYAI